MLHQHVVDGDEVARLPFELDASLLIGLGDPVDELIRNSGAVAEVDVAREQILVVELTGSALRAFRRRGHEMLMELNLIEEQLLTGARVAPHALRGLVDAEP